MKSEILDALLTDRGVDELAPETRELLEAYLKLDARAAARAAAWSETISLARSVVAVPAPMPLPVPVTSSLRRQATSTRLRAGSAGLLKFAATLALGFGVAWWWLAPPEDAAPPSLAQHTDNVPLVDNAAQRFWSRDTFLVRASERSEEDPRLAWSSPVRKPRLEETR